MLELSGNSGVALGITTGLQFLPVLLFGLYGGVLADRYDKRRLLIGAQAAMGVLALALAVLDLTGAVQLWHVFALAFGLGLASVVDTPVRQAFVVGDGRARRPAERRQPQQRDLQLGAHRRPGARRHRPSRRSAPAGSSSRTR